MNFKNTLESVTKDIQEIEKIVSNFQNYSRIPAIELDMCLHKLQNLYELLLLIREHEIESQNSDSKSEVVEPDIKIQGTEPELKEEILDLDENEIQIEEAADEPEMNKGIQNKEVQEVEKETGTQAESKEKKDRVLGEKLSKSGEFLNEKLGENVQQKHTRVQGGPIQSISGSIGINDRFFYIREIFDGNAENFKKTIEILDSAANFNEAFNYIKTQLMVDLENEAVQNLLNLVRRKFISP